jgi:hypothetical protein
MIMPPDVDQVVNHAMESIDGLELPQELQASIERHRKNISNLAASLLAGGYDIDQVRATISVVLDSFKDELLRTVMALKENDDVG